MEHLETKKPGITLNTSVQAKPRQQAQSVQSSSGQKHYSGKWDYCWITFILNKQATVS